MAEDWDSVILDVLDAVEDVGFDATLEKRGAKSGPEYAPVFSAPTSVAMRAVSLRSKTYGYSQGMPFRYDEALLVSVSDASIPEKEDRVYVDGVKYVIKELEAIRPGGTDVAYKLWLKA